MTLLSIIGDKMKELPDWKDCQENIVLQKATPLEKFIYFNEPSEPDGKEFRRQLLAAVNFIEE